MIALGELGSTIALMPVTYLLALFLAWLNGAPFRVGLRCFRMGRITSATASAR